MTVATKKKSQGTVARAAKAVKKGAKKAAKATKKVVKPVARKVKAPFAGNGKKRSSKKTSSKK
jgi:hypothetical protein